MGAPYEGEEEHARVLRALSELCPAYKLYLSHHSRNSLAGILGCCELAGRRLEEGSLEPLRYELGRIRSAAEHLLHDLEKVGI